MKGHYFHIWEWLTFILFCFKVPTCIGLDHSVTVQEVVGGVYGKGGLAPDYCINIYSVRLDLLPYVKTLLPLIYDGLVCTAVCWILQITGQDQKLCI